MWSKNVAWRDVRVVREERHNGDTNDIEALSVEFKACVVGDEVLRVC